MCIWICFSARAYSRYHLQGLPPGETVYRVSQHQKRLWRDLFVPLAISLLHMPGRGINWMESIPFCTTLMLRDPGHLLMCLRRILQGNLEDGIDKSTFFAVMEGMMRGINAQRISVLDMEKYCFQFVMASWFTFDPDFYLNISRTLFLDMVVQGRNLSPKKVAFYESVFPEQGILQNVQVCDQNELCLYFMEHPSVRIYLVEYVVRAVFFFKVEVECATNFFADYFDKHHDLLDLVSQSLLSAIELLQTGFYRLSKACLSLAIAALKKHGGEIETPWLWLTLNEHLGYTEMCTHEPRNAFVIFGKCLSLSEQIFGQNHNITLKFRILLEQTSALGNATDQDQGNLGLIHFIQIWASIYNTGKFFQKATCDKWVHYPCRLFKCLVSTNVLNGLPHCVRDCRVFHTPDFVATDWYPIKTSVKFLETTPLWEPSVCWNEGTNVLFVGTFAIGLINACLETGEYFVDFLGNARNELLKFSFEGTNHKHMVLRARVNLTLAKIKLRAWKMGLSFFLSSAGRYIKEAEIIENNNCSECRCFTAELFEAKQRFLQSVIELNIPMYPSTVSSVLDRLQQYLEEDKRDFNSMLTKWETLLSRAIHRSYQ